MSIATYVKRRDAAVRAVVLYGDLTRLKQLIVEAGEDIPASDALLLITAHKMAVNITTMDEAVKDRAGRWLDENGYSRHIY